MNARKLVLGTMGLVALALVINCNRPKNAAEGEKPGASAVEPQGKGDRSAAVTE